MEKFTNFNRVVDRKGTFSTQWDYTADRFGNIGVLPFSISDMDFALPENILNPIKKVLDQEIFGYTRWKNEELLGSIIGWYRRRFNYSLVETMISYSPTVIYSIAEFIRKKSQEGDQVLLLTPGYDAFFTVIRANKRNIVYSEFELNGDEYQINFDDLEKKMMNVKIFLLCSPHNPLGKVFEEWELRKIVELCQRYDVFLLCDEIHMDLVLEGKHIPILKVADDLNFFDVVIATAASKTFNIPGLLFSYVVSNNLELVELFNTSLKSENGLSSPAILGMHGTKISYELGEEWLEELLEYLRGNLKYLRSELEGTEIKIHKIEATYLIWLDFIYYKANFSAFKEIFYDEVKLGIMDGGVYGGRCAYRINIGCPRSKLEEGVKRLKKGLEIWEERYER